MDLKNIRIGDYSYELPEEKIAAYPLPERDASKLLIYKGGKISEDIYKNIDVHIPAGSLLIFNDTKVIEARILFKKPTGGVVEIFCLEPHEQYADITTAMGQQKHVLWKCLVGGASKWKKGQVLEKKISLESHELILRAAYKEKKSDHFIIELSWSSDASFAEVLHLAGAVPLPPYIKRDTEASDAERYQTTYAHYDGSVAAPTAGLHFTPEIFSRLHRKNIQTGFVTLHVGAGTFRPVKNETIGGHEMHAEYIDISTTAIETILWHLNTDIVAVGTTSLRTIESLYWLGVKLAMGITKEEPILQLDQWEIYEKPDAGISPKKALQTLLDWLKQNGKNKLVAKTQIIIVPGYKTRITKGLVTNFHQPGSTLLLLVAALTGDAGEGRWKKIYDYALRNNFRFLSYGDGCLIWAH
jgi:S-adenosylmethionine:tRNA ribosyltransferase-isomerase